MIFNVGPYCLTLIGDEIAVTHINESLEDESKWTVPPQTVKGISKIKNPQVRLLSNDDMSIIQVYGPDGYGYAINLTDDWCSEWGYCE